MEIDEAADFFDSENPYEKIIITTNSVDEDVQCDVCLEFEYEDDDQIVICDLCNAATHQSCYGSELLKGVPPGNWFCQRCKQLRDNKQLKCTDIKCYLCPSIDGFMKKIDK